MKTISDAECVSMCGLGIPSLRRSRLCMAIRPSGKAATCPWRWVAPRYTHRHDGYVYSRTLAIGSSCRRSIIWRPAVIVSIFLWGELVGCHAEAVPFAISEQMSAWHSDGCKSIEMSRPGSVRIIAQRMHASRFRKGGGRRTSGATTRCKMSQTNLQSGHGATSGPTTE